MYVVKEVGQRLIYLVENVGIADTLMGSKEGRHFVYPDNAADYVDCVKVMILEHPVKKTWMQMNLGK